MRRASAFCTSGSASAASISRGPIAPGFAARVQLDERLRADVIPPATSYARRDLGREFFSAASVSAQEELAAVAARSGIVLRHPFYERKLVDLALQLPEAQRRCRGVPKRVLRRAYENRLPGPVVARAEYFDYTFMTTAAIRAGARRGLLRHARVVQEGWVDAEAVHALLQAVCAHPPSEGVHAAAQRLWPVVAVEAWLRSVLP